MPSLTRYQVALEFTDGTALWSNPLTGDDARRRWSDSCGRFGQDVTAAFLLKDGIVVATARHQVDPDPAPAPAPPAPAPSWTEVDTEVVDGNDTPIRLSHSIRVF